MQCGDGWIVHRHAPCKQQQQQQEEEKKQKFKKNKWKLLKKGYYILPP